MKLKLLLLFLLFTTYTYPQYTSQLYNSKYCEEYIYNDSIKEYVLSESFCDSIEIEIDTIYNNILFLQQLDSIFYLKREFTINDFDYDNEEELYSFFVQETEIPEEYSRNHIIYFSIPDSIITIVLEYQYSICYFLDPSKNP